MKFIRPGLGAPLSAAVLATAFGAITTAPVHAQAQAQAQAQSQTLPQTQLWPAKPIRLVVPFPPGASNDVLSRLTAQAMSPGLGQQILVENRPGGGGIVGSEVVARSPGDGYTLLNIQASFVANAALRPKLPYEPIADFGYVGMMARGPLLMVVHPSLPVKNLREFLVLAKSKPGLVNYGSTGTGSHNHMATELFRRMAGIDIIHVPYKGAAPALTDLMGGHIQLVMTSLPSAMTQVQAGRMRALGVASETRTGFMPQVPTIAEAGVPGYVAEFWWGLVVPVKTPAEITARLGSELARALQSTDLRQSFAGEGAEPATMGGEAFQRFVSNEINRWRKVAQETGIKPE